MTATAVLRCSDCSEPFEVPADEEMTEAVLMQGHGGRVLCEDCGLKPVRASIDRAAVAAMRKRIRRVGRPWWRRWLKRLAR